MPQTARATNHALRRPATLCLILMLLSGVVGCEFAHYFTVDAFRDAEVKTSPALYPKDAERGEPLDIQVDRTGFAITLNNRTPVVYTDVEIWLNHEFYRRIDRLDIGESESFLLADFVNEHGESFPVGSLLEPEKAIPLINAALVQNGRIHAITVRLEENWQRPIIR